MATKIRLNVAQQLEQMIDELNEQLELEPAIEKNDQKQMMKDIKELFESEDFESLVRGDEEFTKDTLDVFEEMGLKHNFIKVKSSEKEEEKENEKVKTLTKKKKIDKKTVKVSKEENGKSKKGEGVIATIFNIISKTPSNKESILHALVKKFPERKEEAMKKTIQAQLPNRMAKEKGVKIVEDEAGRFHATK